MSGADRHRRLGAAFAALALAALVLSGCWSSELRRVTIDVDTLAAWAGQDDGLGAADSLVTAPVLVTTRIPELRTGDVEGVEEFALYMQIQNASFEPVEVVVYAHRAVVDPATLIAEGIRLTRPILVQPQSAFQLDARNYRLFAEGFDDIAELLLGGDFMLYVASESSEFVINGNVPTVSVLVSIKK